MSDTFYTSPEPAAPEPVPGRVAATAKDTRYLFSRLGLAMLVLTIGMVVGQFAVILALMIFAPNAMSEWWYVWVLSLVPLYGFGLPLMLLSLIGVKKAPHNATYDCNGLLLDKPRFHLGHWLLLLVMGLGLTYIGSYVGEALMLIMTALTGESYENPLNSLVDNSPVWATFLATCVCAPLGEEFIFRKLLIDRSRRFGDTVSILISGFFFGLFHGNFFQFFYAFVVGMLLAYIYTRTGRIWWCIGMHAALNFIGSILLPGLNAYLPTDPEATMTTSQMILSLGILVWIFGLMVVAMVLIVLRWRRRTLSLGTEPLYRKFAAVHVLVNPGMLLNYAAMCLLMASNLIPPSLLGT